MQRRTVTYDRRTPQVRTENVLGPYVPPTPPLPPPPPIYYEISGTVTTQFGVVGVVTPIIISTGTITSAANGSYGYLAQAGVAAFTQPYVITAPDSYVYPSVGTNYPDQNFDMPAPVISYDRNTGIISWPWTLRSPYQWEIQQQDPHSHDFETWDYIDGSARSYVVAAYGPPYRIIGEDTANSQITPRSNGVSTPHPPLFVSGTITRQRYSGTGFSAPVVFTGFLFSGTVVSDASSGSYGVLVPYSYSGNAVPSFAATGSFVPASRIYTFITGNQTAQDYSFVEPVYNFTGSVFYSAGGVGVPAATVEVNGGTITTDSFGSFGFARYHGDTYDVIPHASHGSFDPASLSGVAGADTTLDFAFSRLPAVISGEIRLDGAPVGAGAASVVFTGDGQAVTDASGTYDAALYVDYSGTGNPNFFNDWPSPSYTITPQVRVYTDIPGDVAGQDYDITRNWVEISGMVSYPDGPGGFDVLVSNGTGTWFCDNPTGSYGYSVPKGWSGTTTCEWITSPLNYQYTNVLTNQTGQDLSEAVPFVNIVNGSMTWYFMLGPAPQVNPDRWFIAVENPIDAVWTVIGTTAGTVFDFDTAPYYGSFYKVYGVQPNSRQNTFESNWVFSSSPVAASFLISGSVFDERFGGTGFSAPIHFDGSGIITSSASGSYGLLVEPGYSGVATPYITYYCPVPGANVDVALPVGNNASRNVMDTANDLLWIIDESSGSVYYFDVLAGTYAGLVTVAGAPSGFTAVGYDSTTSKVVATAYSGSLVFINPVSKAVSYANYGQATPGYHMLAINDTGTAYVCDNRNTAGFVYAVSCATETLLGSYSLTPDGVYTDSICWAANISQLVINQSVYGGPRFFLFNPTTGAFAASTLLSTLPANYDNYYVRSTGHVIMSGNGTQTSDVIDIAAGTDATIIKTLTAFYGPYRVADACEDACHESLFISEGQYDIFEYSTNGSHLYAVMNFFSNGGAYDLTPLGLAHSRRTNLVYWEDYGGTPIPVRSIHSGSGIPIKDATSSPYYYNAGIANGYYTFSNGNGSFWSAETSSTALGDMNQFTVFDALTFTSLGTDYGVTAKFVYTGSGYLEGRGGGGVSNTNYITVDLNGTSPVSFAIYDASGSFGGTLEYSGTTSYGMNQFNMTIENFAGQENNNPHYLFTTMTATYELRPLGTDDPAPVVINGTWNPPSRTFTSVGANIPNQDFALWETDPPSSDCPVPGALYTISAGTDAALYSTITRNALDPVSNKLYVIDDTAPYIHIYNATAGTYIGNVDTSPQGQYGISNIVYDPVSKKMVFQCYYDALGFLHPTTDTITFANTGSNRWTGYHMLAVDDSGTAYSCDNRQSSGFLNVYDCVNETRVGHVSLTPSNVFTDSICWASNIQRLVINQSGFSNRFFLFTHTDDSFAPSNLVSTTSFNYENYYSPTLGVVLMSRSGATAVDIIDIANGTNATIIGQLTGAPTRVSDATEDTCHNRLFVSDGNTAVYEYTMDGTYTNWNIFDDNGNGISPTGLVHSRRTNLVYYENYNNYLVYTLKATTSGGSIAGLVWAETFSDSPPQAGGYFTMVGGDGAFNGTGTGDATNAFKQVQLRQDATMVNYGPPYAAQMTVPYSAVIYDTGTIDYTSSWSLYCTIDNGAYWASDQQNYQTYPPFNNGTWAGTLVVNGTIASGINTFKVTASALSGASFSSQPNNTFASINGTVTLRPLTPP